MTSTNGNGHPRRRRVNRDIEVYPEQERFCADSNLFRGFVGGRGSGKSTAGAIDLCCRAEDGKTYLVGSPTGVMLWDTTYPTFKAIAQQLNLWASVKLTPYPNVSLANGAVVRFRTAEDPEKMRGPNLSGVWLDEASLMPEEAFTICIAALREHGEQGWLSATFTPKGIYHWTFEVFGKVPPRPHTALFHAVTKDNPFNPPDFEDTLREQYSGLFARQELGGEFLEIEGAEWPAEFFPASMWFDDWPHDMVVRVIALDPSKGKDAKHGDYSAFTLLGMTTDGTIWLEFFLGRMPTTNIVAWGFELFDQFERESGGRVDGFGVESDQFQELLANDFAAETQRRQRFPLPLFKMLTHGVKKEIRIRRLTPLLTNKRIRVRATPGSRLAIRQFQEFPVGSHDDAPDSCEYGVRLAKAFWNGELTMTKRERVSR